MVAFDIREGIVLQGWLRELSVSVLQIRMESCRPTTLYVARCPARWYTRSGGAQDA